MRDLIPSRETHQRLRHIQVRQYDLAIRLLFDRFAKNCHPSIFDFCNNIGTKPTIRDVRCEEPDLTLVLLEDGV